MQYNLVFLFGGHCLERLGQIASKNNPSVLGGVLDDAEQMAKQERALISIRISGVLISSLHVPSMSWDLNALELAYLGNEKLEDIWQRGQLL